MKTEYRGRTQWFWEIIEAHQPSLISLENWMVNVATEDELVLFFGFYTMARERAEEAEHTYPEGADDSWYPSEDGMFELTEWIVSQGYNYWKKVVEENHTLQKAQKEFFAQSDNEIKQPNLVEWDYSVVDKRHRGYQRPKSLAKIVLRTRFNYDINMDDDMDFAIEQLEEEGLNFNWD